MTRPLHIWLGVATGFAILLAALGWISLTTLRLDRVQQQAEQQAEVEERVRLALWRMDSTLTSLMVEESARPSSAYAPFAPADRAYTKGLTSIQQGEVLVPSPLLTYSSSNILLHFQFMPAGRLTSPQVPEAAQRGIALASYIAAEQLQVTSGRLGELQKLLKKPSLNSASGGRGIFSSVAGGNPKSTFDNKDLLIHCATTSTNFTSLLDLTAAASPPTRLAQVPQQTLEANQQVQQTWNQLEQSARVNAYQSAQQRQVLLNNAPSPPISQAAPRAVEGLFTPVWLGTELLLARRVDVGGSFLIQGCWLNWTNLKHSLLANVRDLLPAADLEPLRSTNEISQSRLLAALPVKLVAGSLTYSEPPAWSPVRRSLMIAWICMGLVGITGVVLLHGVLSLSERRAAFVSAVTHELRTPLTTFKMYSEMLAEEMVPDAAKRKQYLSTLCSEANRLGHLVENVLAYARLERGSARSRVEKISLAALIEKVKPRLDQRATQAGMTVIVDADVQANQTTVHVDSTAVEQILFNLVDNACKYAAPTATERTIHLEALPDGRFAMLRVRDHGQGISAAGARRLFQPFCKSAHEAAHTAPGVGLGLALCRRLSRSMGGDLRCDLLSKTGACFVLTLPLARESAAG